MPGTIYRLPDDLTLQRGITYTFLPDGRALRVPSMNRMSVRAAAQGHQENEDSDVVEALTQLISESPYQVARASTRSGVHPVTVFAGTPSARRRPAAETPAPACAPPRSRRLKKKRSINK